MSALGDPRAWLRQAKRDLVAARAKAGDECHRRYWFQQSYEKAVKAYAITLVTSEVSEIVAGCRDTFLRHHSPLSVAKWDEQTEEKLEKRLKRLYPKHWAETIKTVVNVRR